MTDYQILIEYKVYSESKSFTVDVFSKSRCQAKAKAWRIFKERFPEIISLLEEIHINILDRKEEA